MVIELITAGSVAVVALMLAFHLIWREDKA